MKLGGIIAKTAVLALLAGAPFPLAGSAAGTDPEAEADGAFLDGASEEGAGLAPQLPLVVAADGTITAPSGQVVSFVETIADPAGPDGPVERFRFLAPAIARSGGTVTAEAAQTDMQALCDGYALPRVADNAPQPVQIIVSLADRPLPFGETDPEATQFFESFRPENGRCLWEAF